MGLGIVGFLNAYLLTGDLKYLDVWRDQIIAVNANSRVIDGRRMYPRMYGDQGWYDYQPTPYDQGLQEIACLSGRPEDLALVAEQPWFAYLAGRNPGYPETALRRSLEELREKVRGMRQDATTPDTRLSDDPLRFNPASVDSMVGLMLGGIHPGKRGAALLCRLRYFDPVQRRAGLPADVAALIDTLTADSVAVTLLNINSLDERLVLIQAGAYGEHRFESAIVDGKETPLAGSVVSVGLAPGCGARIVFRMRRHAEPPRLQFPWNR